MKKIRPGSKLMLLLIIAIVSYILIPESRLYAGEEKPKIKAKQVEFKKAENKVIFTGDVVITRGKDVLYSDNAVKDEKTDVVEAWGNIHGYFIMDSSETARIKSDRARWEPDSDRIYLSGKPVVIDFGKNTAESNIAEYSFNDKKVTLLKDESKIPFVKYSDERRGDFRADIITVFLATRNMTLEKNAECLIYQ